MDDVMVMKVPDRANQFSKDALDNARSKELAAISPAGKLEKIATGAVVKDKKCLLRIKIVAPQTHKTRMIDRTQDFNLSLETHFNSLLIGATGWAVRHDLNCNQLPGIQ